MATTRNQLRDDVKLRFESLEERRLLAADASTADLSNLDQASTSLASDFLAWQQSQASRTPAFSFEIVPGASYAEFDLPTGLPESFSVEVQYAGETLTLELSKNSIFGENTKFLVDDGTGKLVRVDHGEDRSYLGTVAEDPRFAVSAWLGEAGLHATIIRPNQQSITVKPLADAAKAGLHRIFAEAEAPATYDNHDHNGDGIPDHAPEDHTDETGGGHPPGCTCSACCGIEGNDSEVSALTPSAAAGEGGPFSEADPNISATTLPPSRTIEIREYEVGVEIGSAALLNNYDGSTTQEKVDHAMSVAQGIPGNLDARFLRAAGIKHRLGTVIIRTGSDPFNVANGNDRDGLSAFRNYWNNNPQEVGNTHDLAVYHVRASPSGLAYVNSVGTSNRYALSASNGPTSWADGTLAHEFGHSWSLGHVPNGTTHSANFYESRPRPDGNAPGAPSNQDSRGISIMSGAGSRNIGRLSTGEANQVLGVKQNKLQFGDLVANQPQVAPFGWVDSVASSGGPQTIDVIANDHDANNDLLDVQLLDTVSFQGGTISLSENTGPGGRNEIIYTPPASVNGTDFFHYTVVDSTGRTDWGAVYVTSSAITVDLSQSSYAYDLGTPTSPVFRNASVQATRVTHSTTGDITWSDDVLSEDRPNSGQNDYNRDFVRGFEDRTWSHKIAAGLWRVRLNMSDPETSFDNMFVDAEGVRMVSDIDRPIGVNTTFEFEVEVTDGFLDLTFGDDDTVDPRWAVNRIVLERVGNPVFVPEPSDFDEDGFVDSPDLTQWEADYGVSGDSDADGDNDSDGFDFLAWQRNFTGTSTSDVIEDAVFLGNSGLLTTTSEGNVGSASTSENSLTTNNNGRALIQSSNTGRWVQIPGWRTTRVSYPGGNAAFGFDGANPVGDEPIQYAFVNSGVITLESDPIPGNFTAGAVFELSYQVESNSNDGTATANLIFDNGEVRTFDALAGSTSAVEFRDTFRLFSQANSVTISITMDTGINGNQFKLDTVNLTAKIAGDGTGGASNLVAALQAPPLEQPYIEGELYNPESAVPESSLYPLAVLAAIVATPDQSEGQAYEPSYFETIAPSSSSATEYPVGNTALEEALAEISEDSAEATNEYQSENFAETLDLAFQSL